MTIEFYKYEGTGNDFIIFDNRNQKLSHEMSGFYSRICNRRFGIGGDGVILLQDHNEADFEMIYFNGDGRVGSMCGNGGRCVIQFAKSIGINKQHYKFIASDGIHEATASDTIVKLKMRDVCEVSNFVNYYELYTGSPHYIEFFEQINALDIKKEGSKIRYSDKYIKSGINVNFVQSGLNGIKMRTYERGVEDETYSCGTGVVAAALAYSVENKYITGSYSIHVSVLGGELQVSFEKLSDHEFNNIWLIGKARFVFKGEIEIQ